MTRNHLIYLKAAARVTLKHAGKNMAKQFRDELHAAIKAAERLLKNDKHWSSSKRPKPRKPKNNCGMCSNPGCKGGCYEY